MEKTSHRATVYLEAGLHRALKLKAADTATPVSELVNRAVRLALAEDGEDLAAFDKRAREPSRSFETIVKEMKRDGLL